MTSIAVSPTKPNPVAGAAAPGIEALELGVADLAAAQAFYAAAFGELPWLRLRRTGTTSAAFRGFTLSLLVAQPADVDALVERAVGAGAAVLKPVKKSLWGYGGVVQAPDGSVWKVASSTKKDTAPPSSRIDQVVLLLGATDVSASKAFYVAAGLAVGKSFRSMYVEFDTPGSPVKLALYRHRSLAKDAGLPPIPGTAHQLRLLGQAGPDPDPDGFAWHPAQAEEGTHHG